jgi:nicotinate-nucleotide adenylyltransferase
VRLGILGGSFNPPHYGHLRLAEAAMASGRVEGVLLVPAAAPPHKIAPVEADPSARLAMTRILAAADPRLRVDGLELERPGPSYSVDTVRELYKRGGGDSYRLIIGSDMARIFPSWREYGEILRLAPPLVAERPGEDMESACDTLKSLSQTERDILLSGYFPMDPVSISSTHIRRRLAAGADRAELASLLPETLLDFIQERGIYGWNG